MKIHEKNELSIKQNMLWNSAGSMVNMICQWLISVLVVRLSADYSSAGIYSLAMAVYNTFSQVAQYKTYTVQISDVREEYSVGEYFGFRLLTGFSTLGIVAVYSLLTCRVESFLTIIIYYIYRLASLVIDVLHASDQVHHRMDYIGKSLVMQGLSSVILFAAVFSASGSLELTLACMTAVIAFIGAFFDYPRANSLQAIVIGISLKRSWTLLVKCAPIVIAGIAASAAPSLPRQYLSVSMGDSALGIYASVAAPVAVIQIGAAYIYNPLLSYLSAAYASGDKHSFLRLFSLTFVGVGLVGIICSLGVELLGGPVLSLVYGESILDYLFLLQPMVLCAVLTGVNWFMNDLLIALRSFIATLIGSLISLAAAVLTMVPMQQIFGLNGVTVTSIISAALGLLYLMICLVHVLRRSFEA